MKKTLKRQFKRIVAIIMTTTLLLNVTVLAKTEEVRKADNEIKKEYVFV